MLNPDDLVTIKTAGHGDCAIHAAFGTWNGYQFACGDVNGRRIAMAEAIKTCPPDSPMFTILTECIQALLMEDNGHLKKLRTEYQEHLKQNEALTKAAWEKFSKTLNEHEDIINYIKSSTGHKNDLKELKDQFYVCLNLNGGLLYALIYSVDNLKTQFELYNKESNTAFNLRKRLIENSLFVEEYANYVGTLNQWLLPLDIHLIAYVFTITVNFYTKNPFTQIILGPEIFNPGQTNKVDICFNGRDHFERMVTHAKRNELLKLDNEPYDKDEVEEILQNIKGLFSFITYHKENNQIQKKVHDLIDGHINQFIEKKKQKTGTISFDRFEYYVLKDTTKIVESRKFTKDIKKAAKEAQQLGQTFFQNSIKLSTWSTEKLLKDTRQFLRRMKEIESGLLQYNQISAIDLLSCLMGSIYILPYSVKRRFALLIDDNWGIFELLAKITTSDSVDYNNAFSTCIHCLPEIYKTDIPNLIKLFDIIYNIECKDKLQLTEWENGFLLHEQAMLISGTKSAKSAMEKYCKTANIQLVNINKICLEYQYYFSFCRITEIISQMKACGAPKTEFERFATLEKIEILGEHIKKIPKWFKNENPDIPWQFFSDVRDSIEHQIEYNIKDKIDLFLNGQYNGEGITLNKVIIECFLVDTRVQKVLATRYKNVEVGLINEMLHPTIVPNLKQPAPFPLNLLESDEKRFVQELLLKIIYQKLSNKRTLNSKDKKYLDEQIKSHMHSKNIISKLLDDFQINEKSIFENVKIKSDKPIQAQSLVKDVLNGLLSQPLFSGNIDAIKSLLPIINRCNNIKFSVSDLQKSEEARKKLFKIIIDFIKNDLKQHTIIIPAIEKIQKWVSMYEIEIVTYCNKIYNSNVTIDEFQKFLDIISETPFEIDWIKFLSGRGDYPDIKALDTLLKNNAEQKLVFEIIIKKWKCPTIVLLSNKLKKKNYTVSKLETLESAYHFLSKASSILCQKLHSQDFRDKVFSKAASIYKGKKDAFDSLDAQTHEKLEKLAKKYPNSNGASEKEFDQCMREYIDSGLYEKLEAIFSPYDREEQEVRDSYDKRYNDYMEACLKNDKSFRDALQYFIKQSVLLFKDIILFEEFNNTPEFKQLFTMLIKIRNYLAHDDNHALTMMESDSPKLLFSAGREIFTCCILLEKILYSFKEKEWCAIILPNPAPTPDSPVIVQITPAFTNLMNLQKTYAENNKITFANPTKK